MVSIAAILATGVAIAQAPTIQWEKALGGSGDDYAQSIQQTSDGGYIVAGYTNSSDGDVTNLAGNYDMWVVKLNSSGTVQWKKTIGTNNREEANYILETSNGGYILVGFVQYLSGNNNQDILVVNLTSSGNIAWQQTYGGTSSEEAYDVKEVSGGYIVVGGSWSNDGDLTSNNGQGDFWVLRINTSGGIIWQKNYGGSGIEWASSVCQSSNGNLLVAGLSNSNDGDVSGNHGDYDSWLININENTGALIWEKSYGGTSYDAAYSIIPCSDGNTIFTGSTNSNDGDIGSNHGLSDLWVLKLDPSNGTILWNKTFGGSFMEGGYSIAKTSDNGYFISGLTNSSNGDISGHLGNNDYWVLRLDIAGNLLWQKCLGGSNLNGGTGDDDAYSGQQTSDGGYIVAGRAASTNGDITGSHGGASDYWVVKLMADSIPGCITWDLLSDSSVSSISGDISGLPETIGPGSNPSISLFDYTINGQRLYTGFSGWIAGNADLNRHAEFKLTPNSGTSFTINSISFEYRDSPTPTDYNIIGFQVVYSTGGSWTTIGSGTYRGTIVQTFSYNQPISVPSGATFSLRILPYGLQNGQSGVPTMATHRNVKICGMSVGGGCIGTPLTFTLPAYISNESGPIHLGATPNSGLFSGPGVQNAILYPNLCGLGTKTIKYIYTNAGGCTDSIEASTIVYDTTGTPCSTYDTITVEDTLRIDVHLTSNPNQTGINTLKVYPNPARDHLIIDNGDYAQMPGYSIKITNILGQEVFNQAITQQQMNININNWTGTGTYILMVLDAQQNVVETRHIVIY